MTAVQTPVDSLRRRWRQQILDYREPQSVAARKGFVVMRIVNQSNSSSVFVDIGNLLVAMLYEDDFHSEEQLKLRRIPLRLIGYGVSRVPHGVQWGGAGNSRLFKDLMLTPRHGARGQRIDRSKADLLSLALKLDRRLSRAARHPAAPWPELRLPPLWAGFRSRDIRNLMGDGPEFEQACRDKSVAASALFSDSARHLDGLTLYPLEWISGQLDDAVAVFAELTPVSQRQVFRISRLPEGLIGYQGAIAFDFYNSRFRRLPTGRTESPGDDCPEARNPQRTTIESQLMQSGDLVA